MSKARWWYDCTEEEGPHLASNFEEQGLPGGCAGAMDSCLLIPFFAITSPRSNASDFFPYKSRYGFWILAIRDDRTECGSFSLSTAYLLHATKYDLQMALLSPVNLAGSSLQAD